MKRPFGWRKGQTIFNFLEWLAQKKGYGGNQNARMADPFFIRDGEWDKLWDEFVLEYKTGGALEKQTKDWAKKG